MSYLVIWGDDEPSVDMCASLDAAIEWAERLRNDAGIAAVRIGRFDEIAFSFSARYSVTFDESPASIDTAAPVASGATSASVEPMPEPDEDTSDEVRRVEPGELTEDEIEAMVAVDEGLTPLTADDPVVQDALAARERARDHRGLFGR